MLSNALTQWGHEHTVSDSIPACSHFIQQYHPVPSVKPDYILTSFTPVYTLNPVWMLKLTCLAAGCVQKGGVIFLFVISEKFHKKTILVSFHQYVTHVLL